MSRKHRRISRGEALAHVNTLPVTKIEAAPYDGRTGLEKFRHNYEQAQFAPVRAAESQVSASLRRLAEQDAPSVYVAESSFLAATAPQFVDGSCDGVPVEDIRASIRRAYSEAEDELVNEGRLTESGRLKLQNLSKVNLSTDWLQSAAWVQAYRLLRLLGELTEEDFITTPRPAQEETTVSFDDALEVLPDTRDGRRDAKALCDADYFGREGAAMMTEWENHLAKDYDVVLTRAQKIEVVRWLMKYNKSPLAHESWNAARRALGKAGIIPLMLTEDEKLADRLESSNLNDYSARRMYSQEARRIIASR